MATIRRHVELPCFVLCLLLLALPSLSTASEAQSPSFEQVGHQIAAVMQERDEGAFMRLLNFRRLAERIADTMVESEKDREDFVRGFTRTAGPDNFAKAVFVNLQQRDDVRLKFMRMVDRDRERRALVRLDMGDAGFDYMEFVLEADSTGTPKIVDWYSLSTGELLSVSVGGLSRLLVDPAPGLLKTFFGVQALDAEAVKRLRRVSELRSKGQWKEAYFEMEKLPPEIANSRLILTQRAGLASALGDDDLYRSALEQLAQRYADQPSTAFMLIDHYLYKQDYDRCLQSIGYMEKRVGQDGLTYMLRANIHLLAKQLDESVRNAREGIRVEPDFAGPYFSLIEVLIAQERFPEAVEAFQDMETKFGYEFSSELLEAEPTYAKFVASDAYKKWKH